MVAAIAHFATSALAPVGARVERQLGFERDPSTGVLARSRLGYLARLSALVLADRGPFLEERSEGLVPRVGYVHARSRLLVPHAALVQPGPDTARGAPARVRGAPLMHYGLRQRHVKRHTV